MPDVTIRPRVWDSLKTAAEKHGEKPEALANRALREFLARLADEDLITQSIESAKRSPLRLSQTEEVIRRRRQRSK
jgi:hypothetical protein